MWDYGPAPPLAAPATPAPTAAKTMTSTPLMTQMPPPTARHMRAQRICNGKRGFLGARDLGNTRRRRLMNLIRFAIANPVKVSVGVLLLVLFGLISAFQIPIQLTPNVDQPRITITTRWEGASPEEVEEEIIERQEEKLKGINNLRKMTSTSRQGRGEVSLEFHVGANKDEACCRGRSRFGTRE